MKPEELMIGDWVHCPKLVDKEEGDNGNCQIKQLYVADIDVYSFKELKYDEIEPIPITPEILEKNGFELKPDGYLLTIDGTEQNYVFVQFRHKLECRRIEIRTRRHSYTSNEILYLHELQHALRLCKINKKIKL